MSVGREDADKCSWSRGIVRREKKHLTSLPNPIQFLLPCKRAVTREGGAFCNAFEGERTTGLSNTTIDTLEVASSEMTAKSSTATPRDRGWGPVLLPLFLLEYLSQHPVLRTAVPVIRMRRCRLSGRPALLLALWLRLSAEVEAELPDKVFEEPAEPTLDAHGLHTYRFKYYIHDGRTGDYKTQEEIGEKGLVRGTYSVGEPNGDLRVVSYTAGNGRGFQAMVRVRPTAVPLPAPESDASPVTLVEHGGVEEEKPQASAQPEADRPRTESSTAQPETSTARAEASTAPPEAEKPKVEDTGPLRIELHPQQSSISEKVEQTPVESQLAQPQQQQKQMQQSPPIEDTEQHEKKHNPQFLDQIRDFFPPVARHRHQLAESVETEFKIEDEKCESRKGTSAEEEQDQEQQQAAAAPVPAPPAQPQAFPIQAYWPYSFPVPVPYLHHSAYLLPPAVFQVVPGSAPSPTRSLQGTMSLTQN